MEAEASMVLEELQLLHLQTIIRYQLSCWENGWRGVCLRQFWKGSILYKCSDQPAKSLFFQHMHSRAGKWIKNTEKGMEDPPLTSAY